MTKLILPITFIVISIAGFVMFADPLYKDIGVQKIQAASFNEALSNSKALESERDKLTHKFDTISKDNLSKLDKLLPESVDNIRLILEIEKIAAPYNMVLKDVKYDVATDTPDGTPTSTPTTIKSSVVTKKSADYGVWNLGFSISGSYKNFLNFTKDLESNLRIVDVLSVDFSSDGGSDNNSTPSDFYRYNFKIRTYWLKN
jgi:hypothetical protein